jgi:hypothetical protein
MQSIDSTFDVNARARDGKAFFSEEEELALVVWVMDPETGEEKELVIPFTLLVKLWPELRPTITALEGKLRAGELTRKEERAP